MPATDVEVEPKREVDVVKIYVVKAHANSFSAGTAEVTPIPEVVVRVGLLMVITVATVAG
jgi:hypothetical protein